MRWLASKETNLDIAAGDSMILETAGGGGYGDAKERDREMVKRDLLDGKITPEAAREIYGMESEESMGTDKSRKK